MQTFYTIYKTTCLINGKKYIGQHITKNLNDEYLGSGTLLRRAIKQYGKENFTKDILYVFDNFDAMNEKEKELITEEILLDETYYNLMLGGDAWNSTGTLCVIEKETGQIIRIHKELYSANKHKYEIYGKGKATVYDIILNKHIQILASEFNPSRHRSSFGGIVVEIDGKRQYISKEDYVKSNVKTHTYGMVTVLDLSDNKTKHVPKDEFHTNRHNYKFITEGYATGRHKITNEKRRFKTSDITEEIRAEYNFSTANQITVKVKETGLYRNVSKEEYKNNRHLYIAQTEDSVIAFDISNPDQLSTKYSVIPKDAYNNAVHKLPKDIKFDIVDKSGNIVFSHWGNKKVLKNKILQNFGYRMSKRAIKDINLLTVDNKSPFFECSIKIYDWKKYYGLSN